MHSPEDSRKEDPGYMTADSRDQIGDRVFNMFTGLSMVFRHGLLQYKWKLPNKVLPKEILNKNLSTTQATRSTKTTLGLTSEQRSKGKKHCMLPYLLHTSVC